MVQTTGQAELARRIGVVKANPEHPKHLETATNEGARDRDLDTPVAKACAGHGILTELRAQQPGGVPHGPVPPGQETGAWAAQPEDANPR